MGDVHHVGYVTFRDLKEYIEVCDGFEADVADIEAKERHPPGRSNCYAIVPSNWMVPLCAGGGRKGNEDRTTLSTKCPLERTTEILVARVEVGRFLIEAYEMNL